jgi:hypothetical protein
LLFNEIIIARFFSVDGVLAESTILGIRAVQAVLVIGGLVSIAFKGSIVACLRGLTAALHQRIKSGHQARNAALLAISLIVPWLILLCVTEGDRPERFWWLWPLQVIALTSTVAYFPIRRPLPRLSLWIVSAVLVLSIAGNPLALSRIAAWVEDGWSGSDAEQIRVVDYTAQQIMMLDHRAAIGYDLYIYGFMPIFNMVDRRYKVGADFDMLLKYRHGVENTNQCAEGISNEDQYRIVQIKSNATAEAARERIGVPADPRFVLLRQFDSYQVFQRR